MIDWEKQPNGKWKVKSEKNDNWYWAYKKIAKQIFGQELQLNKDGKTYNARAQDYKVGGVTDIIADPKGIVKKNTDKDGYVLDRDFMFETKGDTTFITGVKN